MIKKIKALYEKHRLVIKYLFFGLITTVISLLICYVTVKSASLVWHDENGDPTQIADILGSVTQWISGVLVAFFTNKLWVFTQAEHGARATFKQLTVFSGARVGTFFLEAGVNLGIIWLLDDLIGINAPVIPLGFMDFELNARIWAKVISSIIVVVTNYYISKLVVFKKKNREEQAKAEDLPEN